MADLYRTKVEELAAALERGTAVWRRLKRSVG
jgi:hypothetical protein